MRRALVLEVTAVVSSGTRTAFTGAFAQHPQFSPQAYNRVTQLEHDLVLRGHVALEVGDFFLKPHDTFVIHTRNPWRIFSLGQCAKILDER